MTRRTTYTGYLRENLFPRAGMLHTLPDDALLQRSTRTVMWTEQKTTRDSLTGYSLGRGVDPDREFGVVILTNLDALELKYLAATIETIAASAH